MQTFRKFSTWFMQPGKYHPLKWSSTFIMTIVVYGIFSFVETMTLVLSQLNNWASYLSIALVATGVLLYGYQFIIKRQLATQVFPKWNWQSVIKQTALTVGIIFAASIANSLFFQKVFDFGAHASANQQVLRAYFTISPAAATFMMLIIAVLAPIMEELTFRYFLIGPSKVNQHVTPKVRRIIYTVISTICFVYLHCQNEYQIASIDGFTNHTANLTLINVLLAYGIIGVALAITYYRTNDVRRSLLVHMSWNTLTLLMMFL